MNRTRSVVLQFILLSALILRLVLLSHLLHDVHFAIQQDGYATYAQALTQGSIYTPQFPEASRRLFPGYPVLIAVVSIITQSHLLSGVLISLAASLVGIYLFWLLTKSSVATALFAFFPPIWVVQATKVATEPLVVALLLGALVLYKNKRYLLAGFTIGYAFDVRIISACLLLALLWHAYTQKAYKGIGGLLGGFLPFVVLLCVYNGVVFGGHILYQFYLNPITGKATIGIVQLVQDVFRAYDWKQYHILVSGVLYVLVNSAGVILLYRKRKESYLYTVSFVWMLLSLLFIFTLGPTPLLEEFSRFTVPFSAALVLGMIPISLRTYRSSHIQETKVSY